MSLSQREQEKYGFNDPPLTRSICGGVCCLIDSAVHGSCSCGNVRGYVSAVFNSELEARSWEACVLVLLHFDSAFLALSL